MLFKENFVKELRDLLIAQTETAVPLFFADNALLAYEGEAPEPVIDKRTKMSYEGTKKVMVQFLRNILLMDIMVNDVSSAECVLYLPDGAMKVSVDSNCSVSEEKMNNQEIITSQMGKFDEFTWMMLSSIGYEKNPCKIFFKSLEESLHFILLKCGYTEEVLAKNMITSELMNKFHIQEPIQIHQMIHLYYGVSAYCGSDWRDGNAF